LLRRRAACGGGALRYAAFLAATHDAVLIPVIAWELPGGDRAERIQPTPSLRQACRDMAREQLRSALLAVWAEIPDDRRVQPHVERGDAGWVLVNLALLPGDVLVLGAGRRGRIVRVFSHVTRYCIARAQCPVVAVPPPALPRSLGYGRLRSAFRHRTLTAEQIIGAGAAPGA
jgi:nucleotide-binding universal stress UspA family protein